MMGKKSVSHDKRVEIITLVKTKEYTQVEIAKRCKVSRKCVQTTIKNYKLYGRLDDKIRTGRPRITEKREDNDLFQMVREKPTSSCRLLSSKWVREGKRGTTQKDIGSVIATSKTVNSRLKEFKLESHFAATKPKLTPKHIKARLKWCKERVNWCYTKWARVVFSDEANYTLINRKTTPRVWRFRNERYQDKMVKKVVQGGGGSVGVWGCIAEKGTGCCATYSGRLKSENYIPLLENNLKPSMELLKRDDGEWLFQQDGASCHTAKSVKDWFKTNNIPTITWPAKSPDLNPIEHLWAKIDTILAKNPPKTLADLADAVTKAWNEIKEFDVITLIESMPKRVEACIKAKGGYFKY